MNPSQKGEALASPLFSQTLLFDWLFNPPEKALFVRIYSLLTTSSKSNLETTNEKS